MLGVVFISGLCVMLRVWTFNNLGQQISHRLRYDLFLHLINKDIPFFEINKTGDLLSRISADTTIVQDALSTNLSMLTWTTGFVIASIFILGIISWKLTLYTFSGIIPLLLFAFVYGKCIKKLTKVQ
jgi:ABC-type bacteriocin/lantibiotic exporter with double-glycine peptidase domain